MSICTGVDDIIDRHLGILDVGTSSPHYGHKESCVRLQVIPVDFKSISLVEDVYFRILENWDESPRRKKAPPSRVNWRFIKQSHLGVSNLSMEKTLEKRIVQYTGDDWVNQVPTASGLYDSVHDRHRNVDLVRRKTAGSYQLIELKVDSDTPLKAAMELLIYTLLYCFAREHFPEDHIASCELLQAEAVEVAVLAPPDYYNGYDLAWLAEEMGLALRAFVRRVRLSFDISFSFLAFPENFEWPCRKERLLADLNGLKPVIW